MARDTTSPTRRVARPTARAARSPVGGRSGRCRRWTCALPRVYPHEYVGPSTAAEVLAPEPIGPLLLVNHKPSGRLGFEHERELQAVAASRFVEELVGKREVSHVVLAGDFDATPDSASVRFWRGLQSLGGTSVCYRDAWESAHPGVPGQTFSPRNPLVSSGNWPLELGRRSESYTAHPRQVPPGPSPFPTPPGFTSTRSRWFFHDPHERHFLRTVTGPAVQGCAAPPR